MAASQTDQFEIMPKVIRCRNCGARMKLQRTGELVRWFRCRSCGKVRKVPRTYCPDLDSAG